MPLEGGSAEQCRAGTRFFPGSEKREREREETAIRFEQAELTQTRKSSTTTTHACEARYLRTFVMPRGKGQF